MIADRKMFKQRSLTNSDVPANTPTLIKGQVFTVFVITVAAAEAAVGLAIVLAIYRNRDTVDMEQFNLLKW